MSKRKFGQLESEISQSIRKRTYKVDPTAKKHSLDSDEEDNVEEDNFLDADDIEGEEDASSEQVGERMTAFNMKEEMDEGHFDKNGHFIWNDDQREIRDNWLDNIDWQNFEAAPTNRKYKLDVTDKGLADDTDSESETEEPFNEMETYKKILTYMKPKETINKAILRLGGDDRKLSSVERLKRKKAGTLNTNEGVYELTELANKILTEKGNMDIYQETYEFISKKIEDSAKKHKSIADSSELDMYSDDFGDKEKAKMEAGSSVSSSPASTEKENDDQVKEVMWVFKWAQENDKVEGPFTSTQMLKWTNEGYFKSGVWVRKHGENTPFYSSNRIDFDLYL